MAIFRICNICGKEIEYGQKCKCELKKDKERYKLYNKYVRNNKENIKYSKFYSSTEWKRLVNYIRSKYKNMCVACLLDRGEINVCDVVHHIIPVRNSWDKRLQEDNLITLCHSCHNKIDHTDVTEDYVKHMLELIRRYKEEYY